MQHRDDDDDHDDSWVKSNSLLPVGSSSSGAGEQDLRTQGRGGGCCRFNVVGPSVEPVLSQNATATTAHHYRASSSARRASSLPWSVCHDDKACCCCCCCCVCVCVCGSRARQKFPSRPVLSADVRSADHCELRSAAEVTDALDLLCGSVQAHLQSAPGPIYKLSHDNLTIILT